MSNISLYCNCCNF